MSNMGPDDGQPASVSALAAIPKALPFLHLSESGILYYHLPAPRSHIILTGPDSPADTEGIKKGFNDPVIYRWTVGTAFPFLQKNAEEMLAKNVAMYERTVARMCELAAKGEEITVDQTPLRFIREIRENGTWAFVGDVGLVRCGFDEVNPPDERERLVKENNERPVGDPNIVWSIGDWLTPSLHGQGIMTSAIRTAITHWALPLMNCHIIRAYILTSNYGSKRVFEKLNFKLIYTQEGGVPMQGKRETELGCWLMEWRPECPKA